MVFAAVAGDGVVEGYEVAVRGDGAGGHRCADWQYGAGVNKDGLPGNNIPPLTVEMLASVAWLNRTHLKSSAWMGELVPTT